MKRIVFAFLIGVIGMLLVSVNTSFAEEERTLIDFPDQKPFVNEDNRTMVPIRFISEQLEAEVAWKEESGTVTIEKEDLHIQLNIDENTALLNNQTITFDTKTVIKNGRAMVPLRFVSEALGAEIIWEPEEPFIIGIVTDTKNLGIDLKRYNSDSTNLSEQKFLQKVHEVYGEIYPFIGEPSAAKENEFKIGLKTIENNKLPDSSITYRLNSDNKVTSASYFIQEDKGTEKIGAFIRIYHPEQSESILNRLLEVNKDQGKSVIVDRIKYDISLIWNGQVGYYYTLTIYPNVEEKLDTATYTRHKWWQFKSQMLEKLAEFEAVESDVNNLNDNKQIINFKDKLESGKKGSTIILEMDGEGFIASANMTTPKDEGYGLTSIKAFIEAFNRYKADKINKALTGVTTSNSQSTRVDGVQYDLQLDSNGDYQLKIEVY